VSGETLPALSLTGMVLAVGGVWLVVRGPLARRGGKGGYPVATRRKNSVADNSEPAD
jgi:hypothetical protein